MYTTNCTSGKILKGASFMIILRPEFFKILSAKPSDAKFWQLFQNWPICIVMHTRVFLFIFKVVWSGNIILQFIIKKCKFQSTDKFRILSKNTKLNNVLTWMQTNTTCCNGYFAIGLQKSIMF